MWRGQVGLWRSFTGQCKSELASSRTSPHEHTHSHIPHTVERCYCFLLSNNLVGKVYMRVTDLMTHESFSMRNLVIWVIVKFVVRTLVVSQTCIVNSRTSQGHGECFLKIQNKNHWNPRKLCCGGMDGCWVTYLSSVKATLNWNGNSAY